MTARFARLNIAPAAKAGALKAEMIVERLRTSRLTPCRTSPVNSNGVAPATMPPRTEEVADRHDIGRMMPLNRQARRPPRR